MSNGSALAQVEQTGVANFSRGDFHDPVANLVDRNKFGQIISVARLMAASTLTPKHLVGDSHDATVANCFRVVNQALRWEIDPFAVADESYLVGGKLGYQGKLVAAVINARAGLAEKLNYSFTGKGDALTVTVTGRKDGEESQRAITLSVGQAKTRNDMWTKDPEQKLCYSGATKWARRHCPEIMLGVLTDDDLERIESNERAAQRPVTSSLEQVAARFDVDDEANTQEAEENPADITNEEEVDDDPSPLHALLTAIAAARTEEELKTVEFGIEDTGVYQSVKDAIEKRYAELSPKKKPKQSDLLDRGQQPE